MNFELLELLYNIPELQTLSYQIYQQLPERISRQAHLAEVWQDCDAVDDPHIRELFNRLEDAENFVGALQERAFFFAGVYLGWGLSQTLAR